MQESFSRLWDGFSTDKFAQRARDDRYKQLKRLGIPCRRFSLAGQVKKYDGLGQPNGSSCTVYYLDYAEVVDGIPGITTYA